MGALWRDIRYTFRTLARSPGFPLAAVLALALGIGPTTILFSLMEGVLLRPLPFREPAELVWIWELTPQQRRSTTSAANFLDWRRESKSFSEVAAYDFLGFDLGGGEHPRGLVGAAVSADLFSLLGVRPVLGRAFTRQEEEPANSNVVVISHRFWQSEFGGARDVLGRTLLLNEQPYAVIGVLPENFWFFLDVLDVFVPLGWEPAALADRGDRGYDAIARPRKGVSLTQADSEMKAMAAQMAAVFPATHAGWSVMVQPVQAHYLSYFRPALRVLLAAVGVVMLVACANAANVLLARGVSRDREIAIRVALGATRGALLRQSMVESLLLAAAGGALSILLAVWSRGALVAILPGELQRRLPGGVRAIGLDVPLLLFVIALTALAGFLVGLLPAWKASRSDPLDAIKHGGAVIGDARRKWRNALVVWQVGLATLALVVTTLLLQSYSQMSRADLGFRRDAVLRVGISLNETRYPAPAQRVALYEEVRRSAAAIPGVGSAALINELFPQPNSLGGPFLIEGAPPVSAAEAPTANPRSISAGYFRLMEIPLLEGRDFAAADIAGAPGVAILSRRIAEAYWPAGDALGRRIRIGLPASESPWLTIVGIAGDVRHPLDAAGARFIYLPLAQDPTSYASLVLRSTLDPQALQPAVEQAIWSIDKRTRIGGVGTVKQWLDEVTSHSRFTAILVTAFGALALVLAVLGVYSASAYAVRRHTRELGIRIALGAQRADILRMVLKEGLGIAAAGIALGLVASAVLAHTPLVASQFAGAAPSTLLACVAGAVTLVLAALAGCLLPARRATQVDPISVLHDE